MIDLEQMKADREAGTDGGWRVVSGPMYEMETVHGPNGACVAEMGCDGDYRHGRERIDARRIARLPELEAAYIEVVAKLVKATEVLEDIECQAGSYHKAESHTEVLGLLSNCRDLANEGLAALGKVEGE